MIFSMFHAFADCFIPSQTVSSLFFGVSFLNNSYHTRWLIFSHLFTF